MSAPTDRFPHDTSGLSAATPAHTAEHHESGIKFSFDVAPAEQASA